MTVLTQPEFEGPLRTAAGNSMRVMPVAPTPWARLTRGHPRVYADYVAWQNASLDVARRLVAHRPTDLGGGGGGVHHVSWGSLIWGTPLWQLPVPLVFGPVGGGQVAPRAFKDYFGDAWPKEALRSWLVTNVLPRSGRTRATMSGARLVVVTNASTEAVVRRMGARSVMHLLDTGLAHEDEAEPVPPPVRPEGTLHLVWIGRLLPIKALPLALEAVALSASRADVRMTVVGGGPQEEQVEDWIAQLGLGDRVRCLGQVAYDRIRPLLQEHDALLFTSLRESFGAQVLEAAARGRPTISLDLHGVSSNLADDAAFQGSGHESQPDHRGSWRTASFRWHMTRAGAVRLVPPPGGLRSANGGPIGLDAIHSTVGIATPIIGP